MYRVDRLFPDVGKRKTLCFCEYPYIAEEICRSLESMSCMVVFVYVNADEKVDVWHRQKSLEFPHYQHKI